MGVKLHRQQGLPKMLKTLPVDLWFALMSFFALPILPVQLGTALCPVLEAMGPLDEMPEKRCPTAAMLPRSE